MYSRRFHLAVGEGPAGRSSALVSVLTGRTVTEIDGAGVTLEGARTQVGGAHRQPTVVRAAGVTRQGSPEGSPIGQEPIATAPDASPSKPI